MRIVERHVDGKLIKMLVGPGGTNRQVWVNGKQVRLSPRSSSRDVFIHGKTIIKLDVSEHWPQCVDEGKLYRSAPAWAKPLLAPILDFGDDWLIQRYYPNLKVPSFVKAFPVVTRLRTELGIRDIDCYGHNVGETRDGRIVCFDFGLLEG